jgi:outer membrane protein, heavy metal efflux system
LSASVCKTLTDLGYFQLESSQAFLERYRVRADEPSAFQSLEKIRFMKILYCSVLVFCILTNATFAQTQSASNKTFADAEIEEKKIPPKRLVESCLPNYFDDENGISLEDIIKKAWENNGELKIARLEVEKSQARLRQAGSRPNPTLDIEQKTGEFTGSKGDNELTVGVSVPLEVFGQRGKRINLAKAEITLKETEVTARKRLLANEVLTNYAEALASLRELKTLEDILELDTETVRFVQIRVTEGDTAPLELNLLVTEVERLRARRILTEGRLQVAISKLKFYAGIDYKEPLKLREEIDSARLPEIPTTLETALNVALKNRPEMQLVELEKQLAFNGLQLIRSQSKPDITAFTRYSNGRSITDSPRGAFTEKDKLLTFGVSIGLPIFNRNQGAKDEAEIAIRQAEERQLYTEQVIKNDVVTAFQRLAAAKSALIKLETAVLPRSKQNLEVIKQVYAIGELKITDLISEQRRLLEANRDLTDALSENYRAKTELLIALGITLEK